MRKIKRFTSLLLAIVMAIAMVGCSDSEKTEGEKTGEEFVGEVVMPTIRIDTVSREENAIDFATKPVSGHVSQQIASWTPGYKMPPEPYYEDCKITLEDVNRTFLLDSADAQVKARGNWTTTYDKKAFRIKFAEKQNLLGLNDGAAMKNWILMAEYKDASMLRNKTAFQIAREILGEDGLYASDAQLVEVFINDKYWGVYLLCEYQQVGENRVAVSKVEKDYTGTDIGYFLEFDGYYYTEDKLRQFFIDYNGNAPLVPFDGKGGNGQTFTALRTNKNPDIKDVGFTIKSDIYCEEQRDFIAGFVDGVYRIMYEAAYNDAAYQFNADYSDIVKSETLTPQQAVEQVVDVESLADMYIISDLTCDADLYWSSFFMSVDFSEKGNKKLTFQAPWDFDSAMGNKDRCADGQGFFASNWFWDVNGNQYKTLNPWLCVLAYEDWYQEIIREKWTKAYDSGVFDRAYEMIENDAQQLSDAFDRNYKKWQNINHESFADELSIQSKACKTHKESAGFLKNWLESRVQFLNSYWHK